MSKQQPSKKPAVSKPVTPAPAVPDTLDFDFSYLETADMEELLSADLRAVFERMAEASTSPAPKNTSPKRRKSA